MRRGSNDFASAPEPYEHSGVTIGGAFTGSVVALVSSAGLSSWGAALLDAQGFDLQEAIRGNFNLTSAGLAIALVTALFLSFLWGGYTAGRMGAGSGTANGVLVGVFTLLILGGSAATAVYGMGADTISLAFGIGDLPLDANLTPQGFAVLGALVLALFGGAVWGSVIGVRWHWNTDEAPVSRYELTGPDSFADLRGRPAP